jgi:hypothetical protein
VPRVTIPAAAAAASATTPLPAATRRYRITAVTYEPEAQLTGQATNFRTLRVVNKGPAGALTIVLALLDFNAAVVIARVRQARTIPLTNTAEGAPVVREGDVVQVESVPTGTGLADPGGTVEIAEEVA